MSRLLLNGIFALPLALASLSCGGDKGGGDGSGPGGDGGGDDGGDDGGDGGGGSTDLARGIQIDKVEVNQGVQVFIASGGQPSGSLSNPVIGNRPALVRAYYTLDSGFEPRKIRGELELQQADGSSEIGKHTIMVEGPPYEGDFEGTFSWILPGQLIQAGATYSITLYEHNDADGTPEPNPPPRIPASGTTDLGAQNEDLTLHVMFVPMRYTGDGKDEAPDLGAEAKKALEDTNYSMIPTVTLDFEYHAEVTWSQPNTDSGFSSILGYLSNLRGQEGAPSNVYYHGLLNLGCGVVGCGMAGTAGIANLGGTVGVSVWYRPTTGSGPVTVVHELGHNQSLSHIRCPGQDAAGPDPSYPHTDGKTGVWGFNVATLDRLYSPASSYDYMSYCSPNWTSDWTYTKTYNRVKALSREVDNAPRMHLLHGLVYADGTEDWWTVTDYLQGDVTLDLAHAVELHHEGEQIFASSLMEMDIGDSDTRWLTAVLPEPIDSIDTVVRTEQGTVTTTDAARINRFREMIRAK